MTEARLRDEREVREAKERLAGEWKTLENEKRKMERKREIRKRTEKLDNEQLQEKMKALEKEWKAIEKEKEKLEEERAKLERQATAQQQQLEKEEKRLKGEAREREEALRKKALADEQQRAKIELEWKKIELEQRALETQKEQLLEEKNKLKEEAVRERRAVAADKKRLKDEWEKVEEERRRVEKERRELEQKEEDLQRAEEMKKKQREYEALMKELEKEKQKIETSRKKMMEEKTQRGNEEGEKESDEVKQRTEITETAIKEEKADEVAQGKTEGAKVHDDYSWDSDESDQEESSQPKANSNTALALMKAKSPKRAQENEDNSPWDSDEEVATPRNTKAAGAPVIPTETKPLKSDTADKVPVKYTRTLKQSKTLSDAQLVDKELEKLEEELEAMPTNGKSTAAASTEKATVPVKHGKAYSVPIKKNTSIKKQSKPLDDDLFDKELEELEKELAAGGPSNKKPTVATPVQRATIPTSCANKHHDYDDDDDFSDDLFDTNPQDKKATKKPAKEDSVDTDAIVRQLEDLNSKFKEPDGSSVSSYERKYKESLLKPRSKAMTGKANENQNQNSNVSLHPQDAIHLKYLKGRRF